MPPLMNEPSNPPTSRREFLKNTGRFAAVSSVAAAALSEAGCKTTEKHTEKPAARPGPAAHNEMIQVALVGCGGRGTGAANNALQTTRGPVKLVAMADVFEARLNSS